MLRRLWLFVMAPDEGAGGGEPAAGGAEGAAPADTGGAPPGETLADGDANASARLDAAFDAEVPDDLSYRDGAKLAADIAKARDTYKPFAEAFGSLDDDARAQLLEVAPNLGADLAVIGQSFALLHPDDRAALASIIQGISVDPATAADDLVRAADAIRAAVDPDAAAAAEKGDIEDLDAAGDLGEFEDEDQEYDLNDPNAPMTMGRFNAMMEAAAAEQAEQQMVNEVVNELRELGYDPESEDQREQVRTEAVLAMARRLDGNLAEAHAALQAWEQGNVDQYVNGRRADAQRPLPPGAGAPPTQERVLETLDDAASAMDARLDAEYGPQRR